MFEPAKPVETLVLANYVLNKDTQKTSPIVKTRISIFQKEDEGIKKAVMKVLEGYDWNLVQASTK